MKNSEFLKEFLLEIPVYESELKEVKEILKEANEHHVLRYNIEKEDGTCFEEQRYIFRIHCPTTGFAMAYYYFGRKMEAVICKRMKIKKQNRSK